MFAILYLSQRIANQEFYIEVVNAAGDMKAYWLFDGTTNTSAKYNCMNKTNTQSDSTQSSLPASSSYSIYEIELYPDETYFFNRSVDSTSTRGTSAVRTRFLPDPNEDYYIQIRAKNLGTAPASSTTFYIDAIAVQDISELTAEITGGRGSIVGSQSIPVALTNTISINSPSVFYSNSLSIDTTTTLSASTAYTGSSKDCGSPLTSSLIRICVGHAGATPNIGHLELQQSADNSTFRTTHKIPIPNDGQFRVFDFPIAMRYLKIVFTNGAVAQTTFGVYSALIRDTNHATNEGTLMIPQTSTALTASATYTGFTMELGGTINATSF
ncbi:MAG: hypothetical protein N2169_07840, partial [bacterium]|nr:hypothetical protein [bacterium]